MVLATEMTKHFEHLARFVSVVNKPPQPDESKDVSFKYYDAYILNFHSDK